MAATGIVYGAADMMGEAADTAANAIGHKNRPSGEELEARKVEKARKITAKSLLARDDTTLPQYLRCNLPHCSSFPFTSGLDLPSPPSPGCQGCAGDERADHRGNEASA